MRLVIIMKTPENHVRKIPKGQKIQRWPLVAYGDIQ